MNEPWDKLAILIPTRNRPGILATTLQELRKAGLGETALWVYDDCSTDPEAIKRVVQDWPQGKVIRGQARVGQAEGRNVLMRACEKEFGLFLDDDSFPKSATGLERHLPEWPDPQRAIVTFQYLDVPTQRLSTPPDVGEGVARSFQGGGSLFHIPKVLGLGGFRSFFVYGYEEPELSMRIQMKGLQIWYDPAVVVHHNHFETPNECRDEREYDYLYARNSILMSSLNMPFWFGLPLGLARSVRRSLYRRRNFGTKARGTLAGLWLSLTLWRERTPCRFKQALAWCRHVKVTRT
jgi:GT2 family glycosyltransferase